MNIQRGMTRLGVVILAAGLITLAVYPLKITHFTPFNSGVSIIIGILAAGWLLYTVVNWIAAGFKNPSSP